MKKHCEKMIDDATEAEAKAWLTDNTTPTPVIDALIKARGIIGETKEILVNKIILKVTEKEIDVHNFIRKITDLTTDTEIYASGINRVTASKLDQIIVAIELAPTAPSCMIIALRRHADHCDIVDADRNTIHGDKCTIETLMFNLSSHAFDKSIAGPFTLIIGDEEITIRVQDNPEKNIGDSYSPREACVQTDSLTAEFSKIETDVFRLLLCYENPVTPTYKKSITAINIRELLDKVSVLKKQYIHAHGTTIPDYRFPFISKAIGMGLSTTPESRPLMQKQRGYKGYFITNSSVTMGQAVQYCIDKGLSLSAYQKIMYLYHTVGGLSWDELRGHVAHELDCMGIEKEPKKEPAGTDTLSVGYNITSINGNNFTDISKMHGVTPIYSKTNTGDTFVFEGSGFDTGSDIVCRVFSEDEHVVSADITVSAYTLILFIPYVSDWVPARYSIVFNNGMQINFTVNRRYTTAGAKVSYQHAETIIRELVNSNACEYANRVHKDIRNNLKPTLNVKFTRQDNVFKAFITGVDQITTRAELLIYDDNGVFKHSCDFKHDSELYTAMCGTDVFLKPKSGTYVLCINNMPYLAGRILKGSFTYSVETNMTPTHCSESGLDNPEKVNTCLSSQYGPCGNVPSIERATRMQIANMKPTNVCNITKVQQVNYKEYTLISVNGYVFSKCVIASKGSIPVINDGDDVDLFIFKYESEHSSINVSCDVTFKDGNKIRAEIFVFEVTKEIHVRIPLVAASSPKFYCFDFSNGECVWFDVDRSKTNKKIKEEILSKKDKISTVNGVAVPGNKTLTVRPYYCSNHAEYDTLRITTAAINIPIVVRYKNMNVPFNVVRISEDTVTVTIKRVDIEENRVYEIFAGNSDIVNVQIDSSLILDKSWLNRPYADMVKLLEAVYISDDPIVVSQIDYNIEHKVHLEIEKSTKGILSAVSLGALGVDTRYELYVYDEAGNNIDHHIATLNAGANNDKIVIAKRITGTENSSYAVLCVNGMPYIHCVLRVGGFIVTYESLVNARKMKQSGINPTDEDAAPLCNTDIYDCIAENYVDAIPPAYNEDLNDYAHTLRLRLDPVFAAIVYRAEDVISNANVGAEINRLSAQLTRLGYCVIVNPRVPTGEHEYMLNDMLTDINRYISDTVRLIVPVVNDKIGAIYLDEYKQYLKDLEKSYAIVYVW